jgi:hypothetical protein
VQTIHRGRPRQWMTHLWLLSTFTWKKTLPTLQRDCSWITHFNSLIFTPICFHPTISPFMWAQGHTLILGKCGRNSFPSPTQYWQQSNRLPSVFKTEETNTQKMLHKHWRVSDRSQRSHLMYHKQELPTNAQDLKKCLAKVISKSGQTEELFFITKICIFIIKMVYALLLKLPNSWSNWTQI